MRAPRSLRSRLLSATLVLAAVGLVVASILTYRFLESFLVSRTDQQLVTEIPTVDHYLDAAHGFGGGPGPGIAVPSGTWAAFLDAKGTTVPPVARFVAYSGQRVPGPRLPRGWPGSWAGGAGAVPDARFLTAGAADGGATRYRVAAQALDNGGSVVVATPLTDVTATLHRLLVLELLVALGVLAGLGALAWWMVRLGLRPLERMGETAGAIAAGDLTRRVEPAEADTEVGRLGLSLNAMLGQIEEAFAERTATEQRLRRFVADASHELRTPLTSIQGYAELFRRGAADRPEDLAKAMVRIEGEAGRMGVLVEDLLLLARLDQGVPLADENVDLGALTERAAEDARAAEPDRPLTVHTAGGHVVVRGDGVRLKQVVDNLLANVRVHTPARTAARVDVASHDGVATIDVADEGPGVGPDAASRIFERFYRADPSRARDRGGVGLGLAIAAEIARAHGGSLDLLATERGARFRLTLPLTAAPAPPGGGG